ncbi:MAG: hypothetical protein J5938_05425 [Clostridia bacterium]|nr:hypothetical protein [Clostridia bacterium]
MSYDLRIGVKVEGTDIIAVIEEPEKSSPTYNLREMFVTCMDWNYNQGQWYKVSEVYDKICRGIAELSGYPGKYKKFNSPNGWGTVQDALSALLSLRDCIDDISNPNGMTWNEIPKEYLWVAW